MEYESKLIKEFIQDYKGLSLQVRELRYLSKKCTDSNRKRALKMICDNLVQNCEIEEKIIHEFMRSRIEDEFQLMVEIGENYHEILYGLIAEMKARNYSSHLFPEKTNYLAQKIESHLVNVEGQIFSCLKYYINDESDEKLLGRYFTELCKKSIIANEKKLH